VTAQYLGAMTMDSRLRGNDEIGQPPVIPAKAGIQYGCINNGCPHLLSCYMIYIPDILILHGKLLTLKKHLSYL